MTERWTTGRYVRTALGCLLVLLDVAIFAVSVYAAAKASRDYAPSWQVVVLHLSLLVAGWALIHKQSLVEILNALPVLGPLLSRRSGP